jgi:hypothetical protein
MLKRTNVVRIIVALAVLVASSAIAGPLLARRDAPQIPPKRQAVAQQGEQSSVIRASNYKSGEVSTITPVNSVGAEAEIPDQSKNGDQDSNEPTQSSSRKNNFATCGK